MAAIVALTIAALLGGFAALAVQVNRPYPGFFFSMDYRVFPVSAQSRAAGLSYGDKILAVDGQSPLDLMARVRTPGSPVHYEVQHDGRRVTVDLSPLPFGWRDLIDHFGLRAPRPLGGRRRPGHPRTQERRPAAAPVPATLGARWR